LDTAQIHILLLEDSDLDADLLQTRLLRAQVPYTIRRIWTHDDFEAALTSNERFDLILADYVLPNFDGMQALNMAHRYCPDTPFIFVSGTLGEEVAIESLKRGATDYVTKQRLDRLPSAVRRAFDEAREKAARQHAEQRLRDINASLAVAVAERTLERDVVWRVSQDLFVICHPDGTIRNTNPAWQEILGWDEPSLHEVLLTALVEEADRPGAQAALVQLNDCAVVRDVDLRMRTRNGQSCHFSWTFVRTDEGPFYGAGRDITHRLDLEAQLRQVQKMESIGQLTGGVAHDFNNLLTIVQGNLGILHQAQNDDTPPRLRAALENARRGADRGAKLTASLLAFSRRQPLAPQVVDVNELVSRLALLLGRTLGEQVQLKVELTPDAWLAFVDPNQLENALINLALNARDAMRADGTLTLRTENRSLDLAYCKLHSDKVPGDYVGLAVSDDGPGMPQDVVARAFDPFFTTKDESKGTGLGLSQVYGFAKQSGGHARIDSAPDHGTTVLINLPRHVR
jgi:signal transduction histidine kinase